MIKTVIITVFFALAGIGCMLAPIEVAARSAGSHASAHSPSQNGQNWHHRRANRFPYGYSYYRPYPNYDSSEGDAPLTAQKPVAEVRRGCEPQSYSVPSSDGGESKITIVRC